MTPVEFFFTTLGNPKYQQWLIFIIFIDHVLFTFELEDYIYKWKLFYVVNMKFVLIISDPTLRIGWT